MQLASITAAFASPSPKPSQDPRTPRVNWATAGVRRQRLQLGPNCARSEESHGLDSTNARHFVDDRDLTSPFERCFDFREKGNRKKMRGSTNRPSPQSPKGILGSPPPRAQNLQLVDHTNQLVFSVLKLRRSVKMRYRQENFYT